MMHALRYLLLLLATLCAASVSAQTAGAVVFASGSAQIVGADGQARALARGTEVQSGDTLDTRDGRAQIRFKDGATVSLQPETRFRVDAFQYSAQDGQAGPDDKGFFSLLKGGFRTITGLLGKARREQYKVSTTVATIGIRGTDYAAVLGEQGLTVNTFGGLVEVCNAAGCLLVAPGESAVVPDASTRPKNAGGSTAKLPGASMVPDLPPPRPATPDVSPLQQSPAPASTTYSTGGTSTYGKAP